MNFDRIVVVSSQSGEKFLGWVPEGEDPKEYMEKPSIVLHNARSVVTQQQPRTDATGTAIVGVAILTALVQIDMVPSAMPKLRLHPSSWYFPSENETAKENIKKLIDAAERNEKISHAVSSGLHVPGVTT